MSGKMKQLFISYRSSDAAKVDKIARDLGLLRHEDGTARYVTWQDKHNLPPASPHWWDAIVDAIIGCDVFVFHLSAGSLQSDVCMAELDYAHKRNRPIIPVVLEGEFWLNTETGKYDLPKPTWALIPEWLRERQFLFFTGTEFYGRFQEAMGVFERNWPRDINAPRPLNPDNKQEHASNHALYDAACDYAERLAFGEAEKHFDVLVRRNDADYGEAAAEWMELIRLYAELVEVEAGRGARFVFKKKWDQYSALFPKPFLEAIFDPKGFARREELTAVQPQAARTAARWRSAALMPAPFDWISIAGKGYSIGKYPVTNAQFGAFIEAGGYHERKWWTEAGWKAKEAGGWSNPPRPWSKPQFWQDSQWNEADQPVVGVSWYEAVAFGLWFSEASGEMIRLPSAEQWHFAAQGEDGRKFPWGDVWDGSRCNHHVNGGGIGKTTPVTQYEGKGDSPFGVVDMAGNVQEWSLTDAHDGKDDIQDGNVFRVLMGESWKCDRPDRFRCEYRFFWTPDFRSEQIGFRLARMDG